MTATLTVEKHLPSSTGDDVAHLLGERKLTFRRERVPIRSIDREASTRNQARFLPLHPELVDQYKAAMEQGDLFPPIILNATKKGKSVVLDGNHRLAAAADAGYTSIDAFLVIEATQAQLELVTFEANARHGLATTIQERIQQGLYLVGLGNQPTAVARALAIPLDNFRKAVTVYRVDQRLRKIGVQDPSKLAQNIRERVGALRNDEVLAPFMEVVVGAGLGTTVVSTEVAALNRFTRDADQLAYVAKLRERYAPEMRTIAGGAIEMPLNVRRLRMAARFVANVEVPELQQSLGQLDAEFRTSLGREVLDMVAKLMAVGGVLRNGA